MYAITLCESVRVSFVCNCACVSYTLELYYFRISIYNIYERVDTDWATKIRTHDKSRRHMRYEQILQTHSVRLRASWSSNVRLQWLPYSPHPSNHRAEAAAAV